MEENKNKNIVEVEVKGKTYRIDKRCVSDMKAVRLAAKIEHPDGTKNLDAILEFMDYALGDSAKELEKDLEKDGHTSAEDFFEAANTILDQVTNLKN